MTTLKERRGQIAEALSVITDYDGSDSGQMAEALVFIDELIEQLEHPARVPVLFISVESVQRMFDELPYLTDQTVTQALVEDLAAALGSGGFLDDALDEALNNEIQYRSENGYSTHDEDE